MKNIYSDIGIFYFLRCMDLFLLQNDVQLVPEDDVIELEKSFTKNTSKKGGCCLLHECELRQFEFLLHKRAQIIR